MDGPAHFEATPWPAGDPEPFDPDAPDGASLGYEAYLRLLAGESACPGPAGGLGCTHEAPRDRDPAATEIDAPRIDPRPRRECHGPGGAASHEGGP